ncbi:heparin lyase I family protein [Massilia sp. CF038]|uniref:heparin lyase I family protein n=1 Tax=Massilia sp. CF038 TaxID=1881045 RepID=UPI00090EDBD3|nr:heparin lyase I family protein [Massilia sp. CF038]SHH40543.1 Polysaccharide lyase [Massilia sp. CF038]
MKITRRLGNFALIAAVAAAVAPVTGAAPVGNRGVSVLMGAPMQFNFTAPSGNQTISNGGSTWTVPNGQIHQRAAGPNITGTWAVPVSHTTGGRWKNMYFRWADTTRNNAIQVTPGTGGTGPVPAYRMEISPADGSATSTPRAELISVDPKEDARLKEPPLENVIQNGNDYWVTYAMHLDPKFPLNHRWATLFQRIGDAKQDAVTKMTGFEIAVHGDKLSYCMPGGVRNQCDYKQLMTVSEARGKWIQFTFHEVASTDPAKGLFEVYANNAFVARYTGATIDSTTANYALHYGYYRSNAARSNDMAPGVGVAYFSPLMIRRNDVFDMPQVPLINGTAPGTPIIVQPEVLVNAPAQPFSNASNERAVLDENFDQFPTDLQWGSSYVKRSDGTSDRFQLSSRGRSGKAMKFTVQPEDKVSNGNRSEVHLVSRKFGSVGNEAWYQGYVMIPKDYCDTCWTGSEPKFQRMVIMQWHDSPENGDWNNFVSHSPLASLRYTGEGGVPRFTLNHGWVTSNNTTAIAEKPIEKGRWYKFTAHIRWAKDTSGFMEAFLDDVPFGPKHYARNMTNNYPAYMKIGMYRHTSNIENINFRWTVPRNSIYWDDVTISDQRMP